MDIVGAVFPVLFFISFLLFFAVFAFAFVSVISQKRKNDRSPRITVPARVVTKRATRSHHSSVHGHHHTSTHYYVTFEFDSRDRLELAVPSAEYGLITEEDEGALTFQGTRFLSFVRS